jgi:hypothetical protein
VYLVLTNSGAQIAARDPHCGDTNMAALTALRQIRDLFMLRGFVMMVDTTPDPQILAGRVHQRLSRELFSFRIEVHPAF